MGKRATARRPRGTAAQNVELYSLAYHIAWKQISPVRKREQPERFQRAPLDAERRQDLRQIARRAQRKQAVPGHEPHGLGGGRTSSRERYRSRTATALGCYEVGEPDWVPRRPAGKIERTYPVGTPPGASTQLGRPGSTAGGSRRRAGTRRRPTGWAHGTPAALLPHGGDAEEGDGIGRVQRCRSVQGLHSTTP